MILLIIIYLVYSGLGLQNSALGAAWPSMYNALGVPNSYLGIVSILIMGFDFVASIYSGKLLKRFQTAPVVAVCMLVIALSLAGFSLSGAFPMLCAFAVPLGLAVGLADVAINNYMAVHFKAKHMNWLHCAWSVGAAVSPVIISYGLVLKSSWRLGYCVVSAIIFASVLVMLRKLPLWERAEPAKSAPRLRFAELFRLKGIKLSLASFFCYCSLETVVALWGSSYMAIVKNASAELSAQVISVFFLGITLGRLFSGAMTYKLNNSRLIRLGCVTVAFGIAMLFLSSGIILQVLGFFLTGVGCSPIIPCLVHDTPLHFKKEYSPSVIGLQMASLSVGATVTPPLFGVVASRANHHLFPLFIGALLAVMVLAIELHKKLRA